LNNSTTSSVKRPSAASSPFRLARCAHRERPRPCRDPVGQVIRAADVVPWPDHLLHQADAQRFCGVELVAGQQPSHRVAPPGVAGQPRGGATQGIDAALDRDLLARPMTAQQPMLTLFTLPSTKRST
jgi:hypothetical protein